MFFLIFPKIVITAKIKKISAWLLQKPSSLVNDSMKSALYLLQQNLISKTLLLWKLVNIWLKRFLTIASCRNMNYEIEK